MNESENQPELQNALLKHEDLNLQLREIGQRLKYYMEQRGLNIETLLKHTGLSRKQVHKILEGKRYQVKNLMPLLETLQDLNGPWLIYGEGEMLKKSTHSRNNETVKHLKKAFELQHLAESDPNHELRKTLKEILAGQKKLLKQNRKILTFLKALHPEKSEKAK